VKPLDQFHRNRASRDGHSNACKPCAIAKAQRHKGIRHHLGRKRFPVAPKGWQFCASCHYLLPLEEFHRDRQAKNGHSSSCKECAITRARRSYRERAQAAKDVQKLYYESNKPAIAEQQASYVARFPQKYSLIKRSYRARARVAIDVPFAKEDIKRQYKLQRGRCYYYTRPLRKVFELDHVIPVSKGGGNESGNVVCACPECNKRKYTSDAEEFMKSLR